MVTKDCTSGDWVISNQIMEYFWTPFAFYYPDNG